MKTKAIIPIQTTSEYDSLIAQIWQLKQDIADLTAEKDDLKGHYCREILADYNEKVGNAEFEATLKLTEIEKLKRVIAYTEIRKNPKIARDELAGPEDFFASSILDYLIESEKVIYKVTKKYAFWKIMEDEK